MTETNWNLDKLYTSLESEEFKKDLKTAENKIDQLSLWLNINLSSNNDITKKLEFYIDFINETGLTLSRLGEYCQLLLSTDSENANALRSLETMENLDSKLKPCETKFAKWLSQINNLSEVINDSPLLSEHKFFLEEVKNESKYILSEEEEIVISKMRQTGSLSWAKLWDSITSSLTIEINGESHPLSSVRNMAHSKDKNLRKTAYNAELEALKSISKPAASALNSIKGEVLTLSEMRGYSSPLSMTLLDSKMEYEVLNSMLNAMKDYQPVLRKYLHKKAKRLGHENGLPFYDLFAPMGESEMTFSYEEAKEFIITNFNSFSTNLGDYAKTAFENRWIDVFPKEGKMGGAFCSNIHSIKESRILTNFSGNLNDVLTLAHELGHGFHGHCLKDASFLNSNYPMPIAETASTFCETLVKNAALKTVSDKQKLVILENDISDNVQIIVDILSRFLFEDEVFKRRAHGSVSSDELCEIMLDAQNKTYGDGLNPNIKHKYMWVVKPHYYDPDYNYYNFPYAFGLLFAKGLYSIYLKQGSSFAKDYEKILAATGNNSHKDIAAMAGIDITKPEFWQSSLKIIENDVNKYIELI